MADTLPPMPDLTVTQRRALAACVMVQANAYRTDRDRFGIVRSIHPWRRLLMAQPHSWKELAEIATKLLGEDAVAFGQMGDGT